MRLKVPLCSLLVVLLSSLAYVEPSVQAWFVYHRPAIIEGEVWRLVSAHWVHFTDEHLIYNLLLFAVLAMFLEHVHRLRFVCLYALLSLSIGVVLFVFRQEMTWYGGLSGIIYGLLLYVALLSLEQPLFWRRFGIAVVMFLLIKISVELYVGYAVWSVSATPQVFVAMPLSHATGAWVALIFYLFNRCVKQQKHA